jgi:hypothetical protein
VLAEGRRPLPITAVTVNGSVIRIETAAGMTFILRMDGDRFTGEIEAGGQSFPLSGERAG